MYILDQDSIYNYRVVELIKLTASTSNNEGQRIQKKIVEENESESEEKVVEQ